MGFKADLANEREFSKRLIRPDTWLIEGGEVSCSTFLVIGEKLAMVIDPGEHTKSIRAYIEAITDTPLIVADTHAHNDHTLANGQFADCPIYASALAIQEHQDKLRENPRGFDPDRYLTEVTFNFAYEMTRLNDGDVIDLGGRRIACAAAGCHSPGSMFFYDDKYKLLFTGDEVDCGQVLIQGDRGNQSVELYRDNLLKVQKQVGEVDMICPAHNGAPADGSILKAFIENCELIMGGREGGRHIASASYLGPNDPRGPARVAELLADPNTRRSEWNGSSIVYSVQKIWREK